MDWLEKNPVLARVVTVLVAAGIYALATVPALSPVHDSLVALAGILAGGALFRRPGDESPLPESPSE